VTKNNKMPFYRILFGVRLERRKIDLKKQAYMKTMKYANSRLFIESFEH